MWATELMQIIRGCAQACVGLLRVGCGAWTVYSLHLHLHLLLMWDEGGWKKRIWVNAGGVSVHTAGVAGVWQFG